MGIFNRDCLDGMREQQDKRNKERREKYANDPVYRERQKKIVKEYQAANPLIRKSQRIKKYDLSLEDYQNMFLTQKGKCAICGYSDVSIKNFFPMVDHDHETGRVRGLLCMNCNNGLGKFKDDINLLKSAILYLGGD